MTTLGSRSIHPLHVSPRDATSGWSALPVAVVVPAHNERCRILDTLRTVDAAARHVAPTTVVVVLDACSDGTCDVVGTFVPEHAELVVLPVDVRCAARARQIGVDWIDGRFASDVAVLSTDADTVVPRNWVQRHVDGLAAGAHGVAGTVDIRPGDADAEMSLSRWRDEYEARFGPGGSHPHVHAANLSVRLDALRYVGGWGDRTRAEDIDLWTRLRSAGFIVRSDRTLRVATSGRWNGRVVGGFATALHQFSATP